MPGDDDDDDDIADSKLAKWPYTDQMASVMSNASAGRLAVLDRSLGCLWVKMTLAQTNVMMWSIVLAFKLSGRGGDEGEQMVAKSERMWFRARKMCNE